MVLPCKLVWKNESLGQEKSLVVDAASMVLRVRLKVAYLGYPLEVTAVPK